MSTTVLTLDQKLLECIGDWQGQIKPAKELGIKGASRYIWLACIDCGKVRWVMLRNGKPRSVRCKFCSCMANLAKGNRVIGIKHHNWKGGRKGTVRGYIQVRVYNNDFFFSMANKQGYVMEHRLVVAKALGRCLQPWEIVHHKNGVKTDNRLENLQLISELGHKQITVLESRIALLEKRITLLEAENVLLRGANQ